jgi:hypothetical protein
MAVGLSVHSLVRELLKIFVFNLVLLQYMLTWASGSARSSGSTWSSRTSRAAWAAWVTMRSVWAVSSGMAGASWTSRSS